jgi:hypothetical protein
MVTFAQWINPEETTMEVSIKGTTTYVVVTPEEIQGSAEIVEQVKNWLEAGNQPLPYNEGGK